MDDVMWCGLLDEWVELLGWYGKKYLKLKQNKIFNTEITINHHHFKSSTVYSVQPLSSSDGDKTVNSVQAFPDV